MTCFFSVAKNLAIMICTLLTLVTMTTRTAAMPWQGTETTTDGVRHVMNPEDPLHEAKIIPLQEVWRTGGDDGEEDLGMGFVTDVQVDDQGFFYLLDSTLNVINVLSADGDPVRQIGREGEGPGEFRHASEFMLMPDGNFGVLQVMPAKVVTMDREGIPGSYFSLCGGARGQSLIDKAQAAGEFLVIGMSCANYEAGGVDYSLSFVDSRGDTRQVIRRETEVDPHGNINIGGVHDKEFIEHWTLATDGRVFVSPFPDQYVIEVYDAQGELVKVIGRQYETLKRTDKALAADRKRQEEMDKQFGGMVQLATRKFERDIVDINARPNGELWVLSSLSRRECPAGTIGLFDVFDTAGRLDHMIGLQADYNPRKDDFLIVGDHLFILKQAKVRPASSSTNTSGGISTIVITGGGGVPDEDEDEEDSTPPSVICYRIPG